MKQDEKFRGQYIIFDLMGVIFKEGSRVKETLYPTLQECHEPVSLEQVEAAYRKHITGKTSEAEFWRELDITQSMPRKVFLEKLQVTFDQDFTGLVSSFLGKTIGIMTNNSKEWADYLINDTGIGNQIQLKIVSADVGILKPDPKIYQLLIQKCGQGAGQVGGNPANILFVDDKLDNLQVAASLGIRTCLILRKPLVRPGYLPDYIIFELKQLEDLVDTG